MGQDNLMESNNQNMILVAAASAAISGGGAHFATKESNLPVTNTSIQDCTPFSIHAREHERADCEIEKNLLRIQCNKE